MAIQGTTHTERARRERWLRRAVWAIAIISVLYAPVAMTDVWRYRFDGAPLIFETLLGKVVSPGYVADALVTRFEPYERVFWAMIVHSVLGGLLMLLGPIQLLTALRRRRGVHRRSGYLYALVTTGSMIGAGIYLLRTPTDEVYSGGLFQAALIALLVGTATSVAYGIFEISRGRRQTHQRWMVLSYGFLLTAPLLRLEWAVLPTILPGVSMDEINLIGTMSVGGIVAFGALCVSRALDRRPRVRGITGTWAPWSALGPALAIGSGALLACGAAMLDGSPQHAREYGGFVVPFLTCCAVAVAMGRRAASAGRAWPAEEWRMHLLGMALVPPTALAVGYVLAPAVGADRATSVAMGLAVSWGAMAVFTTLAVTFRHIMAEQERDRSATRERRRELAAASR